MKPTSKRLLSAAVLNSYSICIGLKFAIVRIMFLRMLRLMKSVVLVGVVMIIGASQAHALLTTRLDATATGKLWILPLDDPDRLDPTIPHPGDRSGINAVFPLPSAMPDMTFSTNFINYYDPSYDPTVNLSDDPSSITIASFFRFYALNAQFSNLFNSALGGVVNAFTPLWSEQDSAHSWGTYIEISGSIPLKNGGHIKVAHDDGVSLMLNGVLTNCFADANGLHYVATGAPEACFYYNGPSGDSIPFDLVYTEGYGGDARLQMAVPEPDILSLLGVGLLGLYGCRSLFHTKMTALLR